METKMDTAKLSLKYLSLQYMRVWGVGGDKMHCCYPYIKQELLPGQDQAGRVNGEIALQKWPMKYQWASIWLLHVCFLSQEGRQTAQSLRRRFRAGGKYWQRLLKFSSSEFCPGFWISQCLLLFPKWSPCFRSSPCFSISFLHFIQSFVPMQFAAAFYSFVPLKKSSAFLMCMCGLLKCRIKKTLNSF